MKTIDLIPVDRLVRLADYLEVPLSQFVAPSDGDSAFQTLASQFSAKEFHTLMEAWGSHQGPRCTRRAPQSGQVHGQSQALIDTARRHCPEFTISFPASFVIS